MILEKPILSFLDCETGDTSQTFLTCYLLWFPTLHQFSHLNSPQLINILLKEASHKFNLISISDKVVWRSPCRSGQAPFNWLGYVFSFSALLQSSGLSLYFIKFLNFYAFLNLFKVYIQKSILLHYKLHGNMIRKAVNGKSAISLEQLCFSLPLWGASWFGGNRMRCKLGDPA